MMGRLPYWSVLCLGLFLLASTVVANEFDLVDSELPATLGLKETEETMLGKVQAWLEKAGLAAASSEYVQGGDYSPEDLASRLVGAVGKSLESFFAKDIEFSRDRSCADDIESGTKALLGSVQREVNGICEELSFPKFCEFYKDLPSVTVLALVKKLQINPISVAATKAVSQGPCAMEEENALFHDKLHGVKKLSKKLKRAVLKQINSQQVEGYKGCKGCIQDGFKLFAFSIVQKIDFTCKYTSCKKIQAACEFAKEHPYLAQVAILWKLKPWEKVVKACIVLGQCEVPSPDNTNSASGRELAFLPQRQPFIMKAVAAHVQSDMFPLVSDSSNEEEGKRGEEWAGESRGESGIEREREGGSFWTSFLSLFTGKKPETPEVVSNMMMHDDEREGAGSGHGFGRKFLIHMGQEEEEERNNEGGKMHRERGHGHRHPHSHKAFKEGRHEEGEGEGDGERDEHGFKHMHGMRHKKKHGFGFFHSQRREGGHHIGVQNGVDGLTHVSLHHGMMRGERHMGQHGRHRGEGEERERHFGFLTHDELEEENKGEEEGAGKMEELTEDVDGEKWEVEREKEGYGEQEDGKEREGYHVTAGTISVSPLTLPSQDVEFLVEEGREERGEEEAVGDRRRVARLLVEKRDREGRRPLVGMRLPALVGEDGKVHPHMREREIAGPRLHTHHGHWRENRERLEALVARYRERKEGEEGGKREAEGSETKKIGRSVREEERGEGEERDEREVMHHGHHRGMVSFRDRGEKREGERGMRGHGKSDSMNHMEGHRAHHMHRSDDEEDGEEEEKKSERNEDSNLISLGSLPSRRLLERGEGEGGEEEEEEEDEKKHGMFSYHRIGQAIGRFWKGKREEGESEEHVRHGGRRSHHREGDERGLETDRRHGQKHGEGEGMGQGERGGEHHHKHHLKGRHHEMHHDMEEIYQGEGEGEGESEELSWLGGKLDSSDPLGEMTQMEATEVENEGEGGGVTEGEVSVGETGPDEVEGEREGFEAWDEGAGFEIANVGEEEEGNDGDGEGEENQEAMEFESETEEVAAEGAEESNEAWWGDSKSEGKGADSTQQPEGYLSVE